MTLLKFIFALLALCSKFYTLHASYAPISPIENVDKSLEDESLISLAHSNVYYDNVGMLYEYDASIINPKETNLTFKGSIVYIGDTYCLTASHLLDKNKQYVVQFEINRVKTDFFYVNEFIKHHMHETNRYFDIAILILSTTINNLTGLNLSYEFSEKTYCYNNNQHLLTYVSYGAQLIYNDWFCFSDKNRRAMQAYTHSCVINPRKIGIFSTPYGNSNSLKQKRSLIPYEAKGRAYMSGGAVIHPYYGLVSIIVGSVSLEDNRSLLWGVRLMALGLINIIIDQFDSYFFPIPFMNDSYLTDVTSMWSVPLGPIKDWIEEIKRSHDISSIC